MKYRTKLYLIIISIALFGAVISFSFGYFQMRKIIFKEMQTEAVSIVASASTLLDKPSVQFVKNNQNSTSHQYQLIQSDLRRIRDLNRRDDIYVKYLYIMVPISGQLNNFEYLIDAEETSSKDYSPIGQVAQEAISVDLSHHLNNIYTPSEFVHDNWGDWMTAYAPIFDQQGKYLATIAINLYAQHVIDKMNRLLIYSLMCLLVLSILLVIVAWFFANKQTNSLNILSNGVQQIGTGDFSTHIEVDSSDEFAMLAQEVNKMALGLQQRDKLQQNFARYVSKHVMESLIANGASPSLTGERRKITLLFSDIRQFTHISEQYRPEKVVQYLNEYFSVMVEIIFRNNGVLDKFIGDGIMVEFGVPVEDDNQELNAVKTAIEMVQGVKDLCNKWRSEGKNIPDIQIGVGIHTGDAVIGNIGSEKRYEYTAIGDTVNSASRIEQLTKEFNVPILFSEDTALAVKKYMPIKFVGTKQIRGKTNITKLYTIE